MKVKEIMRQEVVKISPDASVLEAAVLMSKKEIGSLVVEERDKIGILTERDLLKKVVAKGLDSKKVTVREIMTVPCRTIEGEVSIEEANKIMHEENIRRLLITEGGGIMGIVTMRDIAKSLTYSRVKRKYDYSQEVSGSSWR